jgi:hypothetical protein
MNKSKHLQKIVMDPFCFTQFKNKDFSHINYDMQQFGLKINEFYIENKDNLKEGYAPFCKHLFIENFTDSKPGETEITIENQKYIRSGFEARTEKELPVLNRWIPASKVNK